MWPQKYVMNIAMPVRNVPGVPRMSTPPHTTVAHMVSEIPPQSHIQVV